MEDFEIDPKGLARRNRLWSNLSWGKEYDALSDKLFDGVELTEEEAARFDELSERAEELRDTYEANDVRYLDDYVKDENLFKAYPELKQIRVEIYNTPTSNTGATYYGSQNLIRVNESVLDRADFRNILAHEVQHAVQSIEGFARGGNSMTYRKHLDALKEKRDAWSMIEEFADKREELGEDASQMDVYNALVNEYHSDGFEFGDGFIPSRNAFDKGFNLWVRGYDKEGYEDAYNEYQSLIEKFGLGGENDRYNELSGEVEARNVQSRMNMTPEKRRNTLASETEDVAREDQIFINDALEAYASVSAPMNTAVNELSESLHTPIEKSLPKTSYHKARRADVSNQEPISKDGTHQRRTRYIYICQTQHPWRTHRRLYSMRWWHIRDCVSCSERTSIPSLTMYTTMPHHQSDRPSTGWRKMRTYPSVQQLKNIWQTCPNADRLPLRSSPCGHESKPSL